MPRQIICQFGKHGQKQYKETFIVFKYPEDEKSPGYPNFFIRHSNLKDIIYKLQKNMWIQTVDNWIVPIISCSQTFFRIPEGGSYRRYTISTGAYLFFNPPREYKTLLTNEGGGEKLTSLQMSFCWELAKKWNIIEAVYNAGYDCNSDHVAGIIGRKLIGYKKIKKGIMSAIKIHCDALGLKEEDLALNKMHGLLNSFKELEKELKTNLTSKIKNNTVNLTDIESYLKIVGKFSEEIKTAASWLGYGNEVLQIEEGDDGYQYKSVTAKSITKLSNKNGGIPSSFENLIETKETMEAKDD